MRKNQHAGHEATGLQKSSLPLSRLASNGSNLLISEFIVEKQTSPASDSLPDDAQSVPTGLTGGDIVTTTAASVNATEQTAFGDGLFDAAEEQLGAIVAEQRADVLKWVNRLCWGKGDVEDMTQEVLQRCIAQLRLGEFLVHVPSGNQEVELDVDRLRGWLYRTTCHVVSEFRRDSVRRDQLAAWAMREASKGAPDPLTTGSELDEAIKMCTPKEQSVLMGLGEGYSLGEVAARLGVHRTTATRWRNSARKKLGRLLELKGVGKVRRARRRGDGRR